MSPVLLKLVSKYGYRLPELLTRAVAGDPSAVTILTAAGVFSVAELVKHLKN